LAKRIKKGGAYSFCLSNKEYGRSKQIRFIRKQPLLPIGNIKHKNPNDEENEGKTNVQKKVGRFDSYQLSFENVFMLRPYHWKNPVKGKNHRNTIDNRLSLYFSPKRQCKDIAKKC